MSIRKRLFISNAAMVLMPIFVLILYFLLLGIVFSGDIKILGSNFHQGWRRRNQVRIRTYSINSLSLHQQIPKNY